MASTLLKDYQDMKSFLIRCALVSEQKALEDLQTRASLTNAGDREASLAHPDAIEVPREQIAAGSVFVAESKGSIAGFAALLHRTDGDASPWSSQRKLMGAPTAFSSILEQPQTSSTARLPTVLGGRSPQITVFSRRPSG